MDITLQQHVDAQLAIITKANDIANLLKDRYKPNSQDDVISNFAAITLTAILCGRGLLLNRVQLLDVIGQQWDKFQTMESVLAEAQPASDAVN